MESNSRRPPHDLLQVRQLHQHYRTTTSCLQQTCTNTCTLGRHLPVVWSTTTSNPKSRSSSCVRSQAAACSTDGRCSSFVGALGSPLGIACKRAGPVVLHSQWTESAKTPAPGIRSKATQHTPAGDGEVHLQGCQMALLLAARRACRQRRAPSLAVPASERCAPAQQGTCNMSATAPEQRSVADSQTGGKLK